MWTIHREDWGDNHILERVHCSREFWPIHSPENRALQPAYYGTWFSQWLYEAWKEVIREINFPQLKTQTPTHSFWSQDYTFTEHRLRHWILGTFQVIGVQYYGLGCWDSGPKQWPLLRHVHMHACMHSRVCLGYSYSYNKHLLCLWYRLYVQHWTKPCPE